MERQGRRPVVYLDQNWLSEITKAQIVGQPSKDKPYFGHLFSAIHARVSQSKLVCPTSDFHDTEASFSSELRAPIGYVSRSLSQGLSFNSWFQICHNQLVQAALEFVGQESPRAPWWRIPFNWDPAIPIQEAPDISKSEHPVMLEYMKEVKSIRDGPQTSLSREFKEERQRKNRCFEDEVDFGRIQIFRELHISPAEGVVQGIFGGYDAEPVFGLVALQAIGRFRQLKTICDQSGGMQKFIKSQQFRSAPFLSICAKLRAADIVNYPDHKPEPSLIDDFLIAATILPYSDMFATENYMAELIKQTHLQEEFGCSIFTMKQKKELLDELHSL